MFGRRRVAEAKLSIDEHPNTERPVLMAGEGGTWRLIMEVEDVGLLEFRIKGNNVKMILERGNQICNVTPQAYKLFPGLEKAVTCMIERWRSLNIIVKPES
jgi:hypothetical protein